MDDSLRGRIKQFCDSVRDYPLKKKRADLVILDENDGIRVIDEGLKNWQRLIDIAHQVQVGITLDSWRQSSEKVEYVLSSCEVALIALANLNSPILLPKLNTLQDAAVSDIARFLRDISDLLDAYLLETYFKQPDILVEQIFPVNLSSASSNFRKHVQKLNQYRSEARSRVAFSSIKWPFSARISKNGCLLKLIDNSSKSRTILAFCRLAGCVNFNCVVYYFIHSYYGFAVHTAGALLYLGEVGCNYIHLVDSIIMVP